MAPSNAFAAELTFAHTQRPPYHFRSYDDKKPQGFISEIMHKVLREAKIEADFQVQTANRIMQEAKKTTPFCSFTWFKNPQRQVFANFTHPLWQDSPFVILIKKRFKLQFENHATFESLLLSENLIFGTLDKISYGSYIDNLLENPNNAISRQKIVNQQKNMATMLELNRFDFMIVSPEEIKGVLKAAKIDTKNYMTIGYPDIPLGGKRRIMCNKATGKVVIDKLNKAILKFVPSNILDS